MKTKILIIGALIGAAAGVGAAYMLLQRAAQEERAPRLTAGEGVQLGLGVLGLLKFVSGMGSQK
jgi:hypothetical protein